MLGMKDAAVFLKRIWRDSERKFSEAPASGMALVIEK